MASALLLAAIFAAASCGAASASFVGHTPQTKDGNRLRVLCLGDSITEGQVGVLQERHPYCYQLLELARRANVRNFEVVEEGVSGEVVVPSMVERAMMILGAAEAAGQAYTHIIVEGGLNDINFGRKADDIFSGLLRIYRDCAKSGAHVVAMTIYQYNTSSPALAGHEEIRDGLNILIRDHASSYGEPGKLSLVDLDKHITRETKPKSGSGTSLYSDALHLTAEGYAYMAQLVWEQVFAPVVGATQRRL